MIVPAKYQVFDTPVVLTDKDQERLSPLLVGWNHLAPVLTATNEPDLMRLVVLELLGKQRRKLIDRLLMRLGRVQHARVTARVLKCLPKKR